MLKINPTSVETLLKRFRIRNTVGKSKQSGIPRKSGVGQVQKVQTTYATCENETQEEFV
jgi:hypothetical protein